VLDADALIDAEAALSEPLQRLDLALELQALAIADGVAPDGERPLGGHARVELAEAPGGRVPRGHEGWEAGLGSGLVEPGEGLERQVPLPSHLHHGRRRHAGRHAELPGDGPDGTEVPGDVLALEAVAAGRALDEAPILVGERDGHAVDLGL